MRQALVALSPQPPDVTADIGCRDPYSACTQRRSGRARWLPVWISMSKSLVSASPRTPGWLTAKLAPSARSSRRRARCWAGSAGHALMIRSRVNLTALFAGNVTRSGIMNARYCRDPRRRRWAHAARSSNRYGAGERAPPDAAGPPFGGMPRARRSEGCRGPAVRRDHAQRLGARRCRRPIPVRRPA